MGLAGGVAIAAAERVERAGGPRAGLFAWRKLAAQSASGELLGAAILGGLRCAIALRDAEAARDLAQLWPRVDRGVWDEKTSATCKELARAGMLPAATEIAEAEARRSGTARAIYAFARCLDVAGDARAPAVFSDAAARADKEGDLAMARASRVRRCAWLARQTATLAAAIEEAKAIDARGARPEERLALARVLLRSPSRFLRAGAVGLLDELVSSGDPLTPRALALASRHADDLGEAITPMELDRLAALFGRAPVAKQAEGARRALLALGALSRAEDDAAWDAALEEALRLAPELGPLHRRARAIVAKEDVLVDAASSAEGSAWGAMLDVASALARAAGPRAALSLRQLAGAADVPPQAWTVAAAALASGDEEVTIVAAALVTTMLERCSSPPPRGWTSLAVALAAAGQEDLSGRARRRAARAGELGAAAALASALTREGWQRARQGERARALERLREAKALGLGSS